MEQQLINAFMKLTAKVGAGALVKDLIQRIDENGNPKIWTPTEMQNAIQYINDKVDHFGRSEAMMVVFTLLKKFDIHPDELKEEESEPVPDRPGVQGLQ